MPSLPRRLALAVSAAAATTATAGLGLLWCTRRDAISAVAPDLRSPLLWLPLDLDKAWLLGAARRLVVLKSKPVAGVTVTERTVPGVDGAPPVEVLVVEPAARTSTGGVLWIHGGGYVIGKPEGSLEVASRIARDLGVVVVLLRYRLAPEHPFPAALDDCMAALRWLRDDATTAVDRSRIAVAGESAGGGLAAALAQRATDEGVDLALQLLVYPMLDDRTVLRTDDAGRGQLLWTPRSNRFGWASYLGHEPSTQLSPPAYASPARRTDLAGLPPAWIGVGDLDLFYEENVDYAQRLTDAGVAVDLHIVAGMYHAADQGLEDSAAAMRDFREREFAALRSAVG